MMTTVSEMTIQKTKEFFRRAQGKVTSSAPQPVCTKNVNERAPHRKPLLNQKSTPAKWSTTEGGNIKSIPLPSYIMSFSNIP